MGDWPWRRLVDHLTSRATRNGSGPADSDWRDQAATGHLSAALWPSRCLI